MAPPAQPALDAATLFVRGLSAGTTHAALEAHFSGAAPLRHAFVCTAGGGDAGDGARCRGFGFVQFTNPEDAHRAERLLHGSVLDGRKVRVEFARRRMRNGGRDGGKGGGGPGGGQGGDGGRGGARVDPDGGMQVREKRGRGAGTPADGGREAKRPRVEGALQGSLAMRTVLVRRARGEGGRAVTEAAVARRAAAAADGFLETVMVGGGEVRAVFDSWPKAGKGASVMHGDGWEAVVEGVRGKKCRVIVRNLPFEVDVGEVRGAFEGCGLVREVNVVVAGEGRGLEKWGKGGGGEGEGEGEGEVGGARAKVKCAGYAFVEYFLPAAANHAVAMLNGKKLGGRVVAVDLAVAKAKYETRAGEDGSAGGKAAGGKKGGEGGEEDGGRDDSGHEDVEDRGDGVDEGAGEVTVPVRKEGKSTSEEMSRTVFVRNLLFETSSSELREAMQAFGDVEQAVLVVDSNTGRPRGTAFVRFRDEASAEKAAAAGGAAGGVSSALRAADTAGRIVVGGRPLLVSKAVDRSKARQLAADDAAKGGKEKDPRNLRLAWVGSIKPEAPEAAGLTPDDLKKRAKAEKEKRAKLSHNPNAFVSEVRLSVRNLPRELDEKTLKHMFIHAAGDGAKAKGRAAFAAPKIVHVKILRDAERNGRSKGYGFVQFEKHEHAMAALKKLNNNPKVIDFLIRDSPKALAIDDERARRLRKDWGDGRRLLVEFAVEDRRQVRIIEQIKSRGREKSAAIAAQRSDGDKDDGDAEGAKKVAKRPSPADSRSAKPSGKAAKRAVHKAMKGGLEDGVDADGAGASPPKPTWKSLQADQRKEARGRAQSGGKSGPRRSADTTKQTVSLKPAKPLQKSRRQAKQVEKLDAKEEKFENLVSAYKRKVASALAGPSSGPRWFD